jgi:hypothetical protein
MFREPVSSSSIASIGFDDDSETLEIEFVSGTVYRYLGVSQDVFEAFRTAPSKGTFFNAHIKDAYPWEQVK